MCGSKIKTRSTICRECSLVRRSFRSTERSNTRALSTSHFTVDGLQTVLVTYICCPRATYASPWVSPWLPCLSFDRSPFLQPRISSITPMPRNTAAPEEQQGLGNSRLLRMSVGIAALGVDCPEFFLPIPIRPRSPSRRFCCARPHQLSSPLLRALDLAYMTRRPRPSRKAIRLRRLARRGLLTP